MARRPDPTAPKAAPEPPAPAAGGMSRTLDIRMISLTRERVTAQMHISDKHMNPAGRVNGGAIMAFADVLGARGTIANLPPDHTTSTIESKTNFFAAGQGPVMTGESIPLHIGRTTMVWQTTVTNADGRRVAIVTQTQIVLPGRRPAVEAVPAAAAPAPARRSRTAAPTRKTARRR